MKLHSKRVKMKKTPERVKMKTTLQTSEDGNYTRNECDGCQVKKDFETNKKAVQTYIVNKVCNEWKLTVVFKYYEAKQNLSTTRLSKLTVVFKYYEAKQTYSRI